MATPTASMERVATGYNQLTALNVLQDDVWGWLMRVRDGEYGSELLDFMDYNSWSKPSSNVVVSHYEDRPTFEALPIDANVGAGAPNATVAYNNVIDPTGYGTNGDAFVRDGFRILYPDDTIGTISGVTRVAANQYNFSVTPVVLGDNIPAVTAGDVLFIMDNAFAEDTNGTTSLNPSATRYDFTHQIIKNAYTITGTAQTQKLWFQVDGEKYGSGWTWAFEGDLKAFEMFRQYEENAMLFSEPTTNTTITTGERSMEGVIPYVRNNGGIIQPGAVVNIPFFDNLNNTIMRAFGPREYHWWMGMSLYQRVENFIFNTIAPNGGITFGDLSEGHFSSFNLGRGGSMMYDETGGITGKRVAVALGFKSFEKSGFVHHFKNYRLFNHPGQAGATGYSYPNKAIGVPMAMGRDSMTSEVKAPLCVRYLELGGYSRQYEEGYLGSANMGGLQWTTSQDRKEHHFRSEKTIELFGPNRWVIID